LNYNFKPQAAFAVVFISIFSAFLSGGIIVSLGLYFPEYSQKTFTFISFIVGQSFMLIPLISFLISKKEPLIKRLRINPVSSETIKLTTMFSIGLIILSDEFDRLIQVFIPSPNYIVDLNNLLQPESVFGYILLIIAIAIIAPIGEELLFRGFLQQFLEQHWKDITRAILITSLFFSIIHMNPYWFIQIYILGIMLGFLSWKTNSIFPPLILHALNNGTALLFSFIDPEKSSWYLWNNHVAPWILLLAIVLVYTGFVGLNKSKVLL
jgi:membrane protease YdiL (CAAX protease family)|tara:strand:+ start:406 stop:1203 length:798 start_codon:yes stop_codon:yes gene_type:complete